MSMLTKTADARVHSVHARLVVLGWNSGAMDDLGLIEADVARYVDGAVREGLSPRDMLQDVLDKYAAFFGPCGDVDACGDHDRTSFTFFLRARNGH